MFTEGECVNRKRTDDAPQPSRAERRGRARGSRSMSWREASAASLILTVAHVFIVFLTIYDLSSIVGDPASFAFDLLKFAGASFFGTFLTLTELSKYRDR